MRGSMDLLDRVLVPPRRTGERGAGANAVEATGDGRQQQSAAVDAACLGRLGSERQWAGARLPRPMSSGVAAARHWATQLFDKKSDEARRVALIEASRAWVLSRLLCWGVGLAAVLFFGTRQPFDPEGLTSPFGELGDALVAPSARWDAVWYLRIADNGYENPLSPHFYPLYPLLMRVVGAPLGSSLVGGIVVSLAAFLVALYLLHRLTDLELGATNARAAVLLMAFFPSALFFSAVYTESLFLALSVGAFYAARKGRFAWVGVAAGLAATSRAPGVLLLVPLLLLYFYGPREDKIAPAEGRRFWPRYKPAPDVLWFLAVPVGVACHMAYLWQATGNALSAYAHQANWHQHLTFPLVTFWHAMERAGEGLLAILDGRPPENVYAFALVCLAGLAIVGLLRRLPVAYGVHAAIGLALVLSFPRFGSDLASTSRYLVVYFPIVIWLALWASERRKLKVVLAISALLLVLNTVHFATWGFVS